jgi:hypothetical protein
MLVDNQNTVVFGGNPTAYTATLDAVEKYLTDDKRPRWHRAKGEKQVRGHIPTKGEE